MNQPKLPRKAIVVIAAAAVVVLIWQLASGLRPRPTDAESLAASLLPAAGQPVQIGARLSAEAVELGALVTLTVAVRNNAPDAATPKIRVQLPTSLQLEAAAADDTVLVNPADH
ncbi:MAG: hypothetical protein KC425_01655, partial [Anaerolineales bacterium]|nr:hypothetical protein [Anaerolineales bacterium]